MGNRMHGDQSGYDYVSSYEAFGWNDEMWDEEYIIKYEDETRLGARELEHGGDK